MIYLRILLLENSHRLSCGMTIKNIWKGILKKKMVKALNANYDESEIIEELEICK